MKINHTRAHYVIGLTALALAGYGVISKPATISESVVHEIQKPSRFDWAALGEEKTIALSDALRGKPGKVTIYCANSSCHDLQLDLDDAFQLADWNENIEMRPVDSEEEKGIFVGPPGEDAENLAAALAKATGLEAKIVPIGGIDGVGIIIGKVSR